MTQPPRPRAVIADLPAYVPGRPPTARPGLTTYKLSSNENPFPPLPEIVEAAERALATVNRYPDMACTALYAALAEHLDVAVENFAAGTGSVALIYHLLQAYCDPGDRVVLAWRSFEAYPIAIAVTGAEAVPVPLTASAGHDLGAMAAAIDARTKVVLVCTPNNPTGPALTHTALTDFLAQVPPDVLVVVDEAYRDFVRNDDPVDALALQRAHANVVVLRTFAKASGLAGLRVGYAVAHRDVAAAIRACALPFGVSAVAQATAIAALDHEGALLERVAALVSERDRVTSALAEQGWDLPDAQGNFVWFPLGDRAVEFAARAQEAGLVLRPFVGEGVRASIGEPAANDVLLAVAGSHTG